MEGPYKVLVVTMWFINLKSAVGGIILIDQQRYSTGNILGGLMDLIETVSAEEVRNQLFF